MWRDWEERFGRELLSRDGVVALGPGGGPAVARDPRGRRRAGARDRPAELAERLPPLARRGRRVSRCSTRTAACCACGRRSRRWPARCAIRARLRRGPLGARDGERHGRAARGGGVKAEHGRVVVCAGPARAALARGAGLPLPVRHSRARSPRYPRARRAAPQRLACLLDGSGAFGERERLRRSAARATPPTPSASARRRSRRTAALLDAGGLAATRGRKRLRRPRAARPRARAARRRGTAG